MKTFTTFLLLFSLGQVFAQENKVAFTENKGQIRDQNQKKRGDVVATLESSKGLFVIRKNGFSFQETKLNHGNSIQSVHKTYDFSSSKEEKTYLINRVDINWVNCNQNPEINYLKALEQHLNFYNTSEGQEPILDVSSYKEIILKEIYKGIDVRFYLKDGNLEYDYIVHENAKLNDLKFELQGGNFSLLKNGDLNINSALANILESAPKVFQKGKEIKSSWKLISNQLASFNISKVNRGTDMIIDPVIREWATYVGGPSGESDYNQDIECDSEGNVHLVGSTSSASNIVTSGAFSTILQGITDAFVSKFDRLGNLVWSTYYGGDSFDEFSKIAINNSNTFVCMGSTSSTQSIATNNVFQNALNGASNAFLVSFNANGQRIWATYYSDLSVTFGCDLDNSGNVCISSCVSVSGLSTLGSYQESYNGNTDYFLAKLNNTGNQIWATYYGGSGYESGRSVTSFFDSNGNVFLIGGTDSDDNITSSNAYQVNYNGNEDGIVVKFDANGNRLWGTYFGGNGNDLIYNGFVDNQGNSYIVGETTSDSLLIPASAFQNQWAGNNNYDGLLGKFNPEGELMWATYYGDSLHEEVHSIDVDAKGNVWIAGYTDSDSMATEDGFMTQLYDDTTYNTDLFIVKFDNLGNRSWASYYGGVGSELLGQVCAGIQGDVFLSGTTSSTENISSVGSNHETLLGESDYFLVKFNDKDWNLNSEEINSNEQFTLYPNPAKDFFQVKSSNQHEIKGIQIFDYTGKLVLETKKVSNGKIAVESLLSGIYLIQIDFENSSVVEKFIKE